MGEKMRWDEAEAVVRAYRAERGAATVDMSTVARALGTDVATVRRLAGRKRRFTDGSGVLSAGLALAAVLGVLMVAGSSIVQHHPLVAMFQPKPQPRIEAPLAPTLAAYPMPADQIIILRSEDCAPDET